MMANYYFAILGRQKELALKELEYWQPQNLQHHKKNIVTFQTQVEIEQMPILAGTIKTGKIFDKEEISEKLSDCDLLGVSDNQIGLQIKKEHKLKRYKLVPVSKTDKDVKERGKEIIIIEKNLRGIVTHYQNIALYESLDFEKPSRGMQIGMMPSKLAQLLINIGLQYSANTKTIYDPFCGFGTTCFIANQMGLNSIGSDINITMTKPNIKRRKESIYAKSNPTTIFRHDVLKPLTKPFIKNVDLIITEGRLGPVMKRKPQEKEVRKTYEHITKMYQSLFDNMNQLKGKQKWSAVVCIPDYGPDFENTKKLTIEQLRTSSVEITDENLLYKRAKQKVGRYILIVQSTN